MAPRRPTVAKRRWRHANALLARRCRQRRWTAPAERGAARRRFRALEFWQFGFVSDFGFRASDFVIAAEASTAVIEFRWWTHWKRQRS
jgi:hypothetical protein